MHMPALPSALLAMVLASGGVIDAATPADIRASLDANTRQSKKGDVLESLLSLKR